MRLGLGLALAGALSWGGVAEAQRTVAYDTAAEMTPAAVSCGFCAGEKFGVVFYALPTAGGLLPSDFPLSLRQILVAIARARIDDTLTCQGSAMGGTVNVDLAVYAGMTVPSDIRSLPPSGTWPGETEVFTMSGVPLELSVADMEGSMRYNVMINSIMLGEMGVPVDVPNTYIRVVFTIPSGSMTSFYCEFAGFPEPGAVAIRDDDGRVAPRRSLIYSVGGDFGAGWYWNEEVTDPTMGTTLNGDWVVRLQVQPMGGRTDAGPTTGMDGGTADAGGTTSCSGDVDCMGGERCIGGRCVRTTCTSDVDCAGGMACVEGMCRNLCSVDSDCRGGETCEGGRCTPVGGGGGDDGGCCSVAAGARPREERVGWGVVGLVGLAAVMGWRRWRRRR